MIAKLLKLLRTFFRESEDAPTITSNGVVIITPQRAIRFLKENGTLDSAKKHMKFK